MLSLFFNGDPALMITIESNSYCFSQKYTWPTLKKKKNQGCNEEFLGN